MPHDWRGDAKIRRGERRDRMLFYNSTNKNYRNCTHFLTHASESAGLTHPGRFRLMRLRTSRVKVPPPCGCAGVGSRLRSGLDPVPWMRYTHERSQGSHVDDHPATPPPREHATLRACLLPTHAGRAAEHKAPKDRTQGKETGEGDGGTPTKTALASQAAALVGAASGYEHRGG